MFTTRRDRKSRNRLSLILQLGSPLLQRSESITATSTIGLVPTMTTTTMTSPRYPPDLATPSPFSAMNSPDLVTPLSIHFDPSSSTKAMATVASGEDITTEIEDRDKVRLSRQARKLTQIFGEAFFLADQDGLLDTGRNSKVSKWVSANRQPLHPGVIPGRRSISTEILPARYRTKSRSFMSSISVSTNKQLVAPVMDSVLPTIRDKRPSDSGFVLISRSIAGSATESSSSSSGYSEAQDPPQTVLDYGQFNSHSSGPELPSAELASTHGPATRVTRSNSSRSRRGKTRGRSLDSQSRIPLSHPLARTGRPSTSAGTDTPRREYTLRKSRSLRFRKGEGQVQRAGLEARMDRDAVLRDLREGLNTRPMTNAQRTLSLKRARKLNHVFGSEPPAEALLRASLSTRPPTPDTDMDSPTSPRSFVSSMQDEFPGEQGSEAVPEPAGHGYFSIHNTSVGSVSSAPTSPVARASPTEDGSPVHRRTPSSPPPFSDAAFGTLVSADQRRPSASSEISNTTSFRQRRMRAAKLSRFFGVELRDVIHSAETEQPIPPSAPLSPPSPSVDIFIQQPGKFWSRSDKGKGTDMNDVISRLREMR